MNKFQALPLRSLFASLPQGKTRTALTDLVISQLSNQKKVAIPYPRPPTWITMDEIESATPGEIMPTPEIPENTDWVIWRYTLHRSGKPSVVIFQGKQSKPFGYQFNTVEKREQYLREIIDHRVKQVLEKKQIRQDRKEALHSFKVGDILYSSWGYDQTNIDWYQVVAAQPKSIKIREIASKIVRQGEQSDQVVPVKNDFVGDPMVKIPQTRGKNQPFFVKIKSFITAYPWDGQPKYETSPMAGH